jgi:aspartate/methionine/tyrosine aminotransferase
MQFFLIAEQETNQIISELKLKASLTTESLNRIEGVQCSEVMGSVYAFPRIFLPDKAVHEAMVSIDLVEHTILFNMRYFEYYNFSSKLSM